MKSKFKIGDEIFFMNYSTPAKGTVEGISFVVGKHETASRSKREGTFDKPSIEYYLGGYTTVDEAAVFASKEELQDDLFKELNKQ